MRTGQPEKPRPPRSQSQEAMSLPPISKRRAKPKGAYEGREDAFQKTAIGLVRTIAQAAGIDPKAVMHPPNETATRRKMVFSKRAGKNISFSPEGKRQKALGTVPGYPDIMVHARSAMFDHDVTDAFGQFYAGLAIELKAWPNKPTPDQLHIHGILRDAGWSVAVCYGLDDVQQEAERYFGAGV